MLGRRMPGGIPVLPSDGKRAHVLPAVPWLAAQPQRVLVLSKARARILGRPRTFEHGLSPVRMQNRVGPSLIGSGRAGGPRPRDKDVKDAAWSRVIGKFRGATTRCRNHDNGQPAGNEEEASKSGQVSVYVHRVPQHSGAATAGTRYCVRQKLRLGSPAFQQSGEAPRTGKSTLGHYLQGARRRIRGERPRSAHSRPRFLGRARVRE